MITPMQHGSTVPAASGCMGLGSVWLWVQVLGFLGLRAQPQLCKAPMQRSTDLLRRLAAGRVGAGLHPPAGSAPTPVPVPPCQHQCCTAPNPWAPESVECHCHSVLHACTVPIPAVSDLTFYPILRAFFLFSTPALLVAGGIFVPIIKFLSKSVGDDPEKGTRKKMGAFLVQSQLQQSSYSSALFLTSGAQNLLCLNLAAELGE